MPEIVASYLGELPDRWEARTLAEVCSADRPIVYGIVQAGPHVPDGVPYIRSSDVNGQLRPDRLLRTAPEIARKYHRASLQPGDLVFSIRGNIGNKSFVPAELDGANLTQGTARLAVRAEYLPAFIAYALDYTPVRRRIEVVSKGSTFREITIEDLRKIAIPVPPRQVQEKMVRTLDARDNAIAVLQRLVRRHKKRIAGLMQQLLTGRRRLPAFADQPWDDVHIGDVMKEADRPVDWDEDAIYDLVSVRRWAGGVYTRQRLAGRDIKVKKLKRIETGDVLISHIQSAYGAMAMVGGDHDGHCVSELYTVLVPRNRKRFERRFFAWLCRRRWMWHQAYVASNGFLAERLRINFDPPSFLKRPIQIPPTVQEQRAIADVLDTAQREIDLLKQLRDQIQQQKRGLMQKLLTGQIPVPQQKRRIGL